MSTTSLAFSPDEMVRLELLQYEDPDGLHPVEQAWRNLARKLLRLAVQQQQDTLTAIARVSYKNNLPVHLQDYKPFKFPSKFTTTEALE